MCMIEECERKPVAKGLCSKHYMRLRRAGDPSSVGKTGRKRSWQRSLIEEQGLNKVWSPRTCTRYVQAMEMLREAGCDVIPYIETAQRPNGKLNVSRLQEMAFKRYAVRVGRVSQSEAQKLWKFWKSTH